MSRWAAVSRDGAIGRALLAMHRRHVGIAQPRRRFRQRIEYRLQIKSRTADNFEHIRGCRLLLEGLSQFGQEPCILDGDHRLSCKVRHQFNLSITERSNFLPVNTKDSYCVVILEHWYNYKGPSPCQLANWFIGIFCRHVQNVVRLPRINDTINARCYPTPEDGVFLQNSSKFGGALYCAARRYASPSRSNIEPNVASQMRVAFSSMAWNTGARSPGELLIIRNTSAVAVCCSSDCRSSLSSRAFSMAMTACAAKFCTSAICLSVKGCTSWRKIVITPITSLSLSIGTRNSVRAPARSTMATNDGSFSRYSGSNCMSKICCTCPVAATRASGCLSTTRNCGLSRRNSAYAAGTPCIAATGNVPSLYRLSVPKFASQRRVAFASILSNTGVSSLGELDITRRTSDVAVCCSNDSRNSLSSRVFSMAIMA